VVGLVPADHFRFPVVRLAHVREESAALRELFAAILTEGAVVPPDSLVNCPEQKSLNSVFRIRDPGPFDLWIRDPERIPGSQTYIFKSLVTILG
jgi:hypothetical protein